MAAGICLMKDTADKFIQAVKDGKIDPGKLAEMTSAERNEYFGKIVGENHATAVNSLFESKLLLKNQKAGMVTWAKQVSGIKPKVRQDLLKKIENLQSVLDPGEHEQFMHDLTETRLGIGVTQEEAKNIANLSKKLTEVEATRNPDKTFSSVNQRMAYGRAHYDLSNYVQSLKDSADKFHMSDTYRSPIDSAVKLANVSRAFKTVGDLSISFRNGFKMLYTHPTVWAKAFKTSVDSMFKTLGGKDAWREVQAYVRSSPYYDDMAKANLLPKAEEAYPVHILDKVPVLGRVTKSTQVGYEAMSQMMRVDAYGNFVRAAEKAGRDVADPKFKTDLGKLVGMLTNRGSIGKAEPAAKMLNAFLFSPRALASTVHLATDWARMDYDPYVRQQAAKELAKTVAFIGGSIAMINGLKPGTVEVNPLSSNAAKVKVGDVSFDITGGMGTVATLAARLVKGETKSSTTGVTSSLTSGQFGSSTRLSVLEDFFTNKASPAASTIINQIRGTDAVGNKVTPKSQLIGAAVPLGVETLLNAKADKNPKDPNAVITMLADDLGLSATVTTPKGSNGQTTWSTSTSKEIAQFKQKVGTAKFNAAATKYDQQYNQWLSGVQKKPAFKAMSSDDQKTLITDEKAKIQSGIFKSNGFKYKAQKSTVNKSLL